MLGILKKGIYYTTRNLKIQNRFTLRQYFSESSSNTQQNQKQGQSQQQSQNQQENQQQNQQNYNSNNNYQDYSPYQEEAFNKVIDRIKKYNFKLSKRQEYIQQEIEKKKNSLKENYDKHNKTIFDFQVFGLKSCQPRIACALNQIEYGKGWKEIKDEKSFNQLVNFDYLALQNPAQTDQLSFTVKQNEHFSQYIESPALENYCEKLNDQQLIVFNLPLNATEDMVKNEFAQYGEIGSVTLKYCLVNLPAYAIITYGNELNAESVKSKLPQKIYLNGQMLDIKTKQNFVYEAPWNRTLVIQGIDLDLPFQEVLQELSNFGRVMKFEIIEEVINPALPKQQEVQNFLNNKGLDRNSYQILNIKGGTGSIQSAEKMDLKEGEERSKGKPSESLIDILEKIETNKQIKEQQTKDKIADKVELYTMNWCQSLKNADSQLLSTQTKVKVNQQQQKMEAAEELYKDLSEKEKSEIRNSIQQRKLYQNLGYCFVSFVSTDQAKMAYDDLNNVENTLSLGNKVRAYLRGNSEHYFYDIEHILNRFKQIEGQYKKLDLEIAEQKGSKQGQIDQKRVQFREQVVQSLKSSSNQKQLNQILEDELFSKKKYQFQSGMTQKLDLNKVGRNYQRNITSEDIARFEQNLVEDQNKTLDKYRFLNEQGKVCEQIAINQYQQMLELNSGVVLTDPLQQIDANDRQKRVQEFIKEKDLKQQGIEQEKQIQNQIQENWEQDANQVIKQNQNRVRKLEAQLKKKRDKRQRKLNREKEKGKNEGGEEGEGEEDEEGGEGEEEGKTQQNKSEKQSKEKQPKKQDKPARDTEKKAIKPSKQKQATPSKNKPNKDAFFDPSDYKDEQLKEQIESQLKKIRKPTEFQQGSQQQRYENYQIFIKNLNQLLQGTFQQELKEELYSGGYGGLRNCVDNLGMKYFSSEEKKRLQEYKLPQNEEERKKILEEIKREEELNKVMPESQHNDINYASEEERSRSQWMLATRGLPLQSYKVNVTDEIQLNQYIKDLNQFSAEPGEFFDKSKDKQGSDIVIKGIKPFFSYPVHLVENPNFKDKIKNKVLEIMQKEFQMSEKEALKEYNYAQIHGNYSPETLTKIAEYSKKKVPESEIESICKQFAISRAQYDAIVNLDVNRDFDVIQDDMSLQLSLLESEAKFSQINKEDLVQQQGPMFKKKDGKHLTSQFKQI